MPLRDLALVLVVCLVWGFNFVAGAQAVEAFSPLWVMVLRFCGVLLATIWFIRRPPAGQWPYLAAACLSMGVMHFTLLFWALQRASDVTSIAILANMYIPMAILLAMVFLGERAGWRTLLATGVSFLGVLLIGLDPVVLQNPSALVLILLSVFFQAVASVVMRRVHGIGTMSFQAWTAVFSLPVLLLLSGLFEQGQWQSMQDAQAIHWAAVGYSTLLASLLGHGLFYILVQRNPLPQMMPYLLLMPVFGVLFGVLVWGDRPGWRLLTGGLLVLSGILFITLRAWHKARRLQSLP